MAQLQNIVVPLLLPAEEPATFCTNYAKLQNAVGDDVLVPGQPVLWLAPLAHLRQEKGPLPALPHDPLWWAGTEWREFSEVLGAPHAQAHSAYEPRRFQPPLHSGGLFRPLELPGEMGPVPEAATQGLQRSSVMRAMRATLCQRTVEGNLDGDELWACPTSVGGEWSRCPHQFPFQLARTEAFEVCDGDSYVFLFRDRAAGAGGLDTVMLYSVRRNEWLPLSGATRAVPGGHAGDPPVRWRPVEDRTSQQPCKWAPLKAWLLESTPDNLVLLAPVSRDGVQRGTDSDVHTALHFVGSKGEVVSHHLACHPLQLTMQRYMDHILFVKDFEEHRQDQADACLDDNWHPSNMGIAGWLLSAEDVAVPPLIVHLPSAAEGWSDTACSWSLVLARGNVEELAPSRSLRLDTAPRLYLLEAGASLRLWASRRVDDGYDTVLQRVTLDGMELVRHSLGFQELPDSCLELYEANAFGAWALWSPDLQHAARIGLKTRKLLFWRCAVTYAGKNQGLKASVPCAYRMATESRPYHSSVEVSPLHLGWRRCGLSSEVAQGGSAVTGLPNFPTLRWQEGDFRRPEDQWMHAVAKDACQHAPSILLR